jgi:hypothetical protein
LSYLLTNKMIFLGKETSTLKVGQELGGQTSEFLENIR